MLWISAAAAAEYSVGFEFVAGHAHVGIVYQENPNTYRHCLVLLRLFCVF